MLIAHCLQRPCLLSSVKAFLSSHRIPSSCPTHSSMASKYAAAHAAPKGAGDGRPTALQIVQDEGLEGKLSDKVMLVTGCSSGLGIETARALSATGAKVFCTARDLNKGEKALSGVLRPGRVELLRLDLNSLDSVRACAKDFLSKSKTLNVLVCNAGIMANPTLDRTADGFEAQFGTNHLAHFLLFNLLRPALLESSTPDFDSRVVTLSSTGHRGSGIHAGNYNLENGAYSPWVGYGQSKTANIYMANEIERRYGSRGLHGLSVHPGGIWTALQVHMGEETIAKYKEIEEVNNHMKSPEQGAATTVLAAISKDWEGRGRKYLEDCQESVPVKEGYKTIDGGYAKHAFDADSEGTLWRDSLRMLGLEDDQ